MTDTSGNNNKGNGTIPASSITSAEGIQVPPQASPVKDFTQIIMMGFQNLAVFFIHGLASLIDTPDKKLKNVMPRTDVCNKLVGIDEETCDSKLKCIMTKCSALENNAEEKQGGGARKRTNNNTRRVKSSSKQSKKSQKTGRKVSKRIKRKTLKKAKKTKNTPRGSYNGVGGASQRSSILSDLLLSSDVSYDRIKMKQFIINEMKQEDIFKLLIVIRVLEKIVVTQDNSANTDHNTIVTPKSTLPFPPILVKNNELSLEDKIKCLSAHLSSSNVDITKHPYDKCVKCESCTLINVSGDKIKHFITNMGKKSKPARLKQIINGLFYMISNRANFKDKIENIDKYYLTTLFSSLHLVNSDGFVLTATGNIDYNGNTATMADLIAGVPMNLNVGIDIITQGNNVDELREIYNVLKATNMVDVIGEAYVEKMQKELGKIEKTNKNEYLDKTVRENYKTLCNIDIDIDSFEQMNVAVEKMLPLTSSHAKKQLYYRVLSTDDFYKDDNLGETDTDAINTIVMEMTRGDTSRLQDKKDIIIADIIADVEKVVDIIKEFMPIRNQPGILESFTGPRGNQ